MEIINQRCLRFDDRLERLCVQNHGKQLFYPNGTAKDVFRLNRDELQELFVNLLAVSGINTGLVTQVVDQILADLNNILAIILRVRRTDDNLLLEQFIDLIISNDRIRDTPLLTDEELPIPLETAVSLFSPRANQFYSSQFQFCAVTLRGGREIIDQEDYKSQCPLPYIRQQWIGGGSFGEVFEVVIAQGHFRSTDHQVNTGPELFARKDFKKQYAFFGELDVLKKIMAQPQKHDHLVMVLAILRYHDTYSLFFPRASCDLDQYLKGQYRRKSSERERGSMVYKRGVALAGALAFLHNGLDQVSCLHLDLKPRNVLVFDADDQQRQTWKITDFGMTRVRDRAAHDPENQEGSTVNPGIEGIYLPPETASSGGRVSALSDVWSLGCIFSLVITYILEESDGVKTFAQKRGERPEGNSFYITSRGGTPRISPAVIYWFDHLRRITPKEPEGERRVIHDSLDYLQRKVLHPIRDQRATAKEVETMLQKISQNFHQNAPPSSPLPPHQPQRSSLYTRLNTWLHPRSTKPAYSSLQKFPFDLGKQVLGVRLSPLEGDFLTFFSPQRIDVWSISYIRSSLQSVSSLPLPESKQSAGAPVKCFAVSSRFICTGLAGTSFLCNIYPVHEPAANPRIDDAAKVSYERLGSIKKVAMSLDGALTAFIITKRPSGNESDCKVYLAYTQHLIDTGGEGQSPPPSSRSNSAISETSFFSQITASNLILQEEDVGPAAQIRFLDFIDNGRFLVMVAQEGTAGFSIRAWETFSGKCYANFPIPIRTSPTFSGSLFTACCIFMSKGVPSLILLTDRRHIIHVNLFSQSLKIRTLDIDANSMFVCDDSETLVLIGKNRGLRAYLLPISALDKSDFMRIAKINGISYAPDLDDAAIRRNVNGGLELFIVNASGSFLEMGIADAE